MLIHKDMLIEISGIWTTDSQILLEGVLCYADVRHHVTCHCTSQYVTYPHATVLVTDDFTLAGS